MTKTKQESESLKKEKNLGSKKMTILSDDELNEVTGGKGHNISWYSYRRINDKKVGRANGWYAGVGDNQSIDVLTFDFYETLPVGNVLGPGLKYKSNGGFMVMTAKEFDSLPKITCNELNYIGGPHTTV